MCRLSRACAHRPGRRSCRHADPDEPLAALVFKIVTDPFVGRLAYMRVYSGTLRSNSSTYNSTKIPQRTHWALVTHVREPSRRCGQRLGWRYCRGGRAKVHLYRRHAVLIPMIPWCWRSIQFPRAGDLCGDRAAHDAADEEKLLAGSEVARRRRPDLSVSAPIENTGQTLISGMGELHLEILVERLIARVQRQGQGGAAAGGLSRDDHAASAGRGRVFGSAWQTKPCSRGWC